MSFWNRREYTRNMILTLEQFLDIEEAQVAIYDYINGTISESRLRAALGSAAGVLGLIFIKSTPAGLIAGIVGLLDVISENEKRTLLNVIDYGLRQTINIRSTLRSLNATRADVNIAFLEFTDEDFRIVQGMSARGYEVNGQWQYID